MRYTRRFAVLAMGIALVSSTVAQAQTAPHASDGQTLALQPPSTQSLFQSVWGANAESRWITEHDAVLGLTPSGAAVPVPVAALSSPVLVIMNDKDRFSPSTLTVPRGTTITWRNDDTDPHTVTGDPTKSLPGAKIVAPSNAKPWDSGLVDQGQSYTYTLDTIGHYIYICTVHAGGGMVATIDVTG